MCYQSRNSLLLPFLILMLLGLLPVFSGCAGSRVKAGDEIMLHYTCRLPSGEIATTTDMHMAEDPNAGKASFFYPSNKKGAVRMFPGQALDQKSQRDLRLFETEVRAQLADRVIGLPYDQVRRVTIASQVSEELEKENRYISFERVRTKPLFQKVSREHYVRGQGQEPVVGGRLSKGGMEYAKVVAVEGEEVTLEVLADQPLEVDTPWGKAVSVRKGDQVQTTIDAKVGTIVRTGGALGRITEVNETRFVVDYGHPFAYETLSCEVMPQRTEATAAKE